MTIAKGILFLELSWTSEGLHDQLPRINKTANKDKKFLCIMKVASMYGYVVLLHRVCSITKQKVLFCVQDDRQKKAKCYLCRTLKWL